MTHITSIIALIILGIGCILWPKWLINGQLDSWYLKIATFIAAYGGFIANLIWYIQHVR
jgi:hypothetical protein